MQGKFLFLALILLPGYGLASLLSTNVQIIHKVIDHQGCKSDKDKKISEATR